MHRRYAAGATVQILLFGILAIEIKRKAPTAHTVLEIVSECPESYTLIVWCSCCFACPVLVLSSPDVCQLRLGSAQAHIKCKSRMFQMWCINDYIILLRPDARWGKAAHLTFFVFCIMTNILVTSMLLLGGAAVINALTGMSIYAVSISSLDFLHASASAGLHCAVYPTTAAVNNRCDLFRLLSTKRFMQRLLACSKLTW